MEEIWQIAGLFLFSAVRFFLAPPAAVIAGYGFLSTVIITFSGGSIGFVLYYKFWQILKTSFAKLFKFKKKGNKKTFSKKNKLIVKAKLNYGMIGIALLTPILLSIPFVVILAANYYPNNKKVIPVFLSSILIWSIGLTYISLYIKLP